MALTAEEKIKSAEDIKQNNIDRTLKRWVYFFSGPEHEYNAAIQNYDYAEQRNDFIQIVARTSPDLNTIKKLISSDYRQWRKNAGL